MNNFHFHNPVKILFGKGQIAKLADLLKPYENILFLWGQGSIKSNGVYHQVAQALKELQSSQNLKVEEFSGVEPNPRYETLMKAAHLCREKKIDFILAVGGGSVIDGAKFIAAAALAPSALDPWQYLTGTPVSAALKLGTVLTLPATGSEMNSFSVVSRENEKKEIDKLGFGHPLLYPQFSILDPETTYSLSEKQLANGLVDAFVHTTEQYLTIPENTPLQSRMATSVLKTLLEEAPKVIELKNHYESRANFMWSATMALNGIIGVGVTQDWATHMIGHELTALYGIDHARSLALILPSLLRVTKEQKSQKLDEMGREVFHLGALNFEQRIDVTINKIEDYFNSLGVPTKLKYYQINSKDFPVITQRVLRLFPQGVGVHQSLKEKEIMAILNKAY